MRDERDDLFTLLDEAIAKAGLRIMFDGDRNIMDPCSRCGRTDAPRDLIDIAWDEQRRDAITRPFCAECAATLPGRAKP